MKANHSIKYHSLVLFAAMLSLPLMAFALTGTTQGNSINQSAQDDKIVMPLGKIKVHGEQNIIRALQDIKVALRQPYSNDPALANVVVCRLIPVAGSHIKSSLICGTNRVLNQQRDALHIAMTNARGGGALCGQDLTCIMNNTFNGWTPILQEQPSNLLTVTVNSAQLRGLLHKIPDPNSAAEIMHFGTLMIHGQTDIYQTLQAIKLALHQARSNDPKLASVAVCRFQNEPNDQAEELLICATNAAWPKHTTVSSPAYVAATAAMPVTVVMQTQYTVLNPMLMSAPGNELQTKVDGTALRALLEKIPYPTSASPATPAPATSTHS